MKLSEPHKKRSYSVFYKIYRRIRYIRHVKKQRKIKLEVYEIQREAEKEEADLKAREQLRKEKALIAQKRKQEREYLRQQREEIRSNLRKNKEIAQKQADMEKAKVEVHRLLTREERIQRRKRLLKYYFKLQRKKFWKSLLSFNYTNLRHQILKLRESRDARKQFGIIFLNSTVYFLLSYFFLYLLNQAVTIFVAYLVDFPTILYYYEVYFNIDVERWTAESVKAIYSAGPLVSLLLGFISIIFYYRIRTLNVQFKIFFLWTFMHSMAFFFGAMLIGSLFESGLGHVLSWMYIMDTGKVLYSIISIFVLVITGFFVTKSFLISANSYFTDLIGKNSRYFIHSQVTFAFLAGNLILFLVRYPQLMLYEVFVNMTMLIPVVALVFNSANSNDLYFDEEPRKIRFRWILALSLVVIILLYRVALIPGLKIG